mmetsp:Transcript_57096/g.185589  ORF Transcript_57096/g.185589 Transcript_57096/m.185589 type:complete len:81 (+) Transcript_57096:248-490(+)
MAAMCTRCRACCAAAAIREHPTNVRSVLYFYLLPRRFVSVVPEDLAQVRSASGTCSTTNALQACAGIRRFVVSADDELEP